MTIPEPSGPTLAADEATFAQQVAEAQSASDRRQQQAEQFQVGGDVDVTAGSERL